MFNQIGKKLSYLMAKEGISGMRLAFKLGIPASTFKKIRSQEVTNPTLATLAPIARYFGVPLEYFTDEVENDNLLIKQHFKMPLISWIQALNFSYHDSAEYNYILSHKDVGRNGFALKVSADITQALPHNSLVVVNQGILASNNDLVITAVEGSTHASLQQFISVHNQPSLQDLGPNQAIRPFTSDYRLIGVVTEYYQHIKNL